MRPRAIVHFEILFVISLVFGSAVSVITWNENVDGISAEANFFAEILGTLLYTGLALWASRGRSNIARWIIAVIIVLGSFAIALSLSEISEMDPIVAFTLPAYMCLQIAAIIFLFSSDAQSWFRRS